MAESDIEFREELSHGICWLEGFELEVVLSTAEKLIYPWFWLLVEQLSLLKVVCRPKWMPWMPVFWVLSMLVVQSSCFPISFPPRIVHSTYLSMRICLCWIRGSGEIGLLRVYRFFVGSIFGWWCTQYVVYEYIIIAQLADGQSDVRTDVKPWWLWVVAAGRSSNPIR